jgi:hypothetical protein
MFQPSWLAKLREVLMKTSAFLFCIALAMTVNIALADTVLITDLESGNPFQQWGVGSWQARTQQIVTNYDTEIGVTGNWLEDGTGAFGYGQLIIPRWGTGVWDTWNAAQYNAHSNIEFDAVLYSGEDNMSWPSNTLGISFNREGAGFGQAAASLNLYLDVTNSKDAIAHFSIPYSQLDAVAVPDQNDWFQGYINFFTTTTDGTIYLDNFKFTGDPLPVPEPSTIVLLGMAGLVALVLRRRK